MHRDDRPGAWVSRPIPHERPTIDAPCMHSAWQRTTRPEALYSLAASLGLLAPSLIAIGAVEAIQHRAWAFPMRDGQGNIVGIRLRNDQGRKWAVPGSRQGVFESDTMPQSIALITEGPTDTAAAIGIGFYALGRPSCNTGGAILANTVRRLGIRRVIMVSDNDDPGLQGAQRVGREIGVPFVVWVPPCKDLRKWVQLGGTRCQLESEIKNFVWTC
jgi:hypothetical protein